MWQPYIDVIKAQRRVERSTLHHQYGSKPDDLKRRDCNKYAGDPGGIPWSSGHQIPRLSRQVGLLHPLRPIWSKAARRAPARRSEPWLDSF